MKRLILILVSILFSAPSFADVEYDQDNAENFEEYGPVHDVFQEPKDNGDAAELRDEIADARGDFQNTVPEPKVKQSSLAGVERHKKVKKVAHKVKKQARHSLKKHAKRVARHKVKKSSRHLAKTHKKSKTGRSLASTQKRKASRLR